LFREPRHPVSTLGIEHGRHDLQITLDVLGRNILVGALDALALPAGNVVEQPVALLRAVELLEAAVSGRSANQDVTLPNQLPERRLDVLVLDPEDAQQLADADARREVREVEDAMVNAPHPARRDARLGIADEAQLHHEVQDQPLVDELLLCARFHRDRR